MINSSLRPGFRCSTSLFFALCFFVASSALRAQSDTLEHTLLWRIDGNGLEKASYLYGTFHTADARVFDFRDSVITALLSCETVAFELHFDSMSTETLRMLYAPDSVLDLREYLTEEEFALLDERIRQGTGLPGEFHRYTDPSFLLEVLDQPQDVSFEDWDLEEGGEEYSGEGSEEDPEEESAFDRHAASRLPKETFLDAWLFRTALLEGKQVIGLETIGEQIAIADTIPLRERIRMLVETITVDAVERWATWRAMVEAYQEEDPNRLFRIINDETMRPGVLFKMLTERNHHMADRMVPIMRRGSLFTAVGAGHLPGEEGLIALLRRKGFNVTPVLSERTGVASRYKRPGRELPWYTLVDGEKGFSVETPIPTVDFPLHAFLSDLTTYQLSGIRLPKSRRRFVTDITTELSYFIIEEEVPLATMLSDDLFISVRDEWFGNNLEESSLLSLLGTDAGKVMRSKKVEADGVPGMEFTGVDTDGDLTRLRVFQRGGELYTFMVSGGTSVIKSKDDSRFLKSVRFLEKPALEWEAYDEFDFPLMVRMPSTPVYDTTREWSMGGSGYASTFSATAVDPSTGIYYVIEQMNVPPSSTVFTDSLLLREMFAHGIPVDSIVSETKTGYAGPDLARGGSEYQVEFASGATLRRRIDLYGGRAWSMSVARTKGASDPAGEKRFFDETKPLGRMAGPERFDYAGQNFSTEFLFPSIDSSEYGYYSGTRTFEAGEWRDERAHVVTVMTHSPYYETESEEEFFDILRQRIVDAGDSIVDERRITEGGLNWHERTVVIAGGDTPGRVYRERLALHGTRLYNLRWFSLDPNDDPDQAGTFFSTFRLLDPNPQGDLFSRKVDLLLNDLSSSDSATRANANSALWGYVFREEDLPKLYEALKRDYPDPVESYDQPTESRLVGAFRTVHDDRTVKVLTDLYRDLPPGNTTRSNILDVLAAIRTDESLKAFKKLLIDDPPTEAYGYLIFSSFYGNLSGIEKLYPEILEPVESVDLRATIFDLTNSALDSSLITVDDIRSEHDRLRQAGLAVLEEYSPTSTDYEEYESTSDSWSIDQWQAETTIALLGKLPPDKKVDNQLKRTLRDTNLNVRRASAVALLQHGEEVREKWLTEVAVDPLERLYLYRGLKGAGKLDRFPKKYTSQILFAESLVSEYLYWSQEYPPEEIEYVADRSVEWNGEKLRGYLFKYRYQAYGEDYEWGPWQVAFCAQPDDFNRITDDAKYVRVNWTDFDPERIDEHFEELMAQEEIQN